MKHSIIRRLLAVFLCAAVQLSSVSYPVPDTATNTLAPFCQEFSKCTTVPQRIGEAFEAVLVSALRHWGQLQGWAVQHSVDIPKGFRTRPDLCFGADPAQMLEQGKIIVEDIKLSRDPSVRYPDTFAGNKYRKFRYHYAVLSIEETNRQRILNSLEGFLHWITDDNVRVAHNAPELKDWGRIWTVIGTRINRVDDKESYTLDDQFFSSCFKPFYDRMKGVIARGELVDVRDGEPLAVEELRMLLKNALYSYEVRKEVRIVHPALLTLAGSRTKMFAGLEPEEQKAFGSIELTYPNIFTEWGHFFRRGSSKTILQTLQFFIGMYLGLWDFDADEGMESNIDNIRWTDKKEEIAAFPLFRFHIQGKISKLQNWFRINNKPVHLSYVSRSLRVGPRKGKVPSAENFQSFAYNASMFSYFNDDNLEPLAKETIRLFFRERDRLKRGGVNVRSIHYVDIMAGVVRRLGINELYKAKPASKMAKKHKTKFLSLMISNWPITDKLYIHGLLDDAVKVVAAQHRSESAYYGHKIIRNEALNKSKKLMRSVGYEILKAETDGQEKIRINLADLAVEGDITGRQITRAFARAFKERFNGRWPEKVLREFSYKYLESDADMVFTSIAQARMFLFYVGYLRDILLADEVEEAHRARLKKFTQQSSYKTRYLISHGVRMDYDTGKVHAPSILPDGEYSEIAFSNLGTCIRGYSHIIEKLSKESNKIAVLLEFFKINKEELLAEPDALAEFAEQVIGLRERAPKNALNVMIHNIAVDLRDACRTAAPDKARIDMFVDVLMNNLESRFNSLRGMRFTFIERNSAILRAADGRLEKVKDVFDVLNKSREPLREIEDLRAKTANNTTIPRDIRDCYSAILAQLKNGYGRNGAVVVLNDYIKKSELVGLDDYFYGYKNYKEMVSQIKNWANAVSGPMLEEAA